MPSIAHFFKQKRQQKDKIFSDLGAQGRAEVVLAGRKNDWLEESFINESESELARGNKNFIGLAVPARRLRYLNVVIGVLLFILFVRSFQLQVVQGEYYHEMAEQNRIRNNSIAAPRGIIYDRNGIALVRNVPSYAIFIIPSIVHSLENQTEVTNWLHAELKGYDFESAWEKIMKIQSGAKEYYEPVLLTENVPSEKALIMEIESAKFPGVQVNVVAQRAYLTEVNGESVYSLAHLLGYVGGINEGELVRLKSSGYRITDNLGKTGLESQYEPMLRGVFGLEKVEVDSRGRAIKLLAQEPVVKGNNLFLSLDVVMQAKIEQLMKAQFVKIGKTRGVAIINDPQSGKILAMVSWPSYDNNHFAQGIDVASYQALQNNPDKPLYNRAISGEYPSGSTFKTIVGTAALEEQIITENNTVMSTGGIRIDQWFFPDWNAGGHGLSDIRKAIAESVNTFFYIVGGGYQGKVGLGVDKIKEYAERFGLGRQSGIDLPNENDGFVPSPEWKLTDRGERWYVGDTYHFAIGQGDLLVTPLQVADYCSVFANRGTLYQPRLLDYYYDQKNANYVKLPNKELNKNFVQLSSIDIIRSGMRRAVTSGSARLLQDLPVTSAAKTGTAEWGAGKDPHAWFMAFAPYETPEISIVVLIEEGKEGSTVAAPIANDFLKWYFKEYKSKFDNTQKN